jgi:hypothetical protein
MWRCSSKRRYLREAERGGRTSEVLHCIGTMQPTVVADRCESRMLRHQRVGLRLIAVAEGAI